MNEKILDALMRLFALITDPTDVANNRSARVVVEAYLRGLLSPTLVEEYLVRFDKYLDEYQEAIQEIDELPGIGKQSAETILAETGLDMSRFPTEKQISSWSGLAPGNNESAGKRKSGRTTKGNPTLKATLIQCAKSAVRNTKSYFYAQYQRLVVRRGRNRATVAVAHSMLIAIYHILKEHVPFRDLGAEYYNQFNRERKIKGYVKKLEKLGVDVSQVAWPIETA